jgi:exosome complex RNA-binding protein Rrp4
VGQNGVIWLDGEPEDVSLAVSAIRKVEDEAHTTGLTDKVRKFLEEHGRTWKNEGREGGDGREAREHEPEIHE